MKNPLAIAAVVIVLFGGVYLLSHWKPGAVERTTREVALTCTTDMATEFHIHPVLTIIANGEQVPIPANIGITSSCMMALHTHTADGIIHVESPEARDFTLGDFFAVWQKPFSKNQIMEFGADDTHTITMTVNGEMVDTFENTVLKDKDQIVITYGTNL